MFWKLCTCYSKCCDQAVSQCQVHEQGGGPLLPHPLPQQCADGESVAYGGDDHQAWRMDMYHIRQSHSTNLLVDKSW